MSPLQIANKDLIRLDYTDLDTAQVFSGKRCEGHIFFEDGAYYGADIEAIEKTGNFIDTSELNFIFAEKKFQIDIDTEEDFTIAQSLYQKRFFK